MKIVIILLTLMEISMAEEYEPVDQPSTSSNYSPSYQPVHQSNEEPDEQINLMPIQNEELEKTWTKKILKDPIRVSTSPSSPLVKGLVFDIEKEKEKLKKSCYPVKERLEFLDNDPIQMLTERNIMSASMILIGLMELRSVLHFEPYPSWDNKSKRIKNDDEIADAKTTREYYELVEPEYLPETPFKRTLQLTELVDEQFPSLRKIYRKHLEEKLAEFKGGNLIDRNTVDYMIKQFNELNSDLVKIALEALWFNDKC
ncbi:unnamed protein product [Caenorhabditis brenneri]